MKRIPLLVLITFCLGFASCNMIHSEKNTASAAPVTTEMNVKGEEPEIDGDFNTRSIQLIDSVQFFGDDLDEWIDTDMSYFYADFQMPVTANAALKDSIERFIKCSGERHFDENMEIGDGMPLLQALRDEYRKTTIVGETHYEEAKMEELTDRYVTYSSETRYSNYGAPRDYFVLTYATFHKDSGKKFGWNMFKNQDEFLELMRSTLLNACDLDVTGWDGEDFYAYDGPGYKFAKPGSMKPSDINIWISNDKVEVKYNGNEFDPDIKFTYDDIKDLLTEDGQNFFE